MDEDIVGLQRAVTGKDLAVCDLCGAPDTGLSVVRNVAEAGIACMSAGVSRAEMERDELPIDAEIAAGLPVRDE